MSFPSNPNDTTPTADVPLAAVIDRFQNNSVSERQSSRSNNNNNNNNYSTRSSNTSSTRLHSMRESASMVFDTILRRKRQDYHGDDMYRDTAPEWTRSSHAATPAAVVPSVTSAPQQVERSRSRFQTYQAFWCTPEIRHHGFLHLLNSRVWRTCMVIFAFVLLFGEQIRSLFLPPASDNYVDTLFVISILFFLTDIAMRCDAEDGYFTSHCCCCPSNSVDLTSSTSLSCLSFLSCGSFLFWCDLLSTIALLYDISWIRTRWFSDATVEILLNNFGVPVRVLAVVVMLHI
jgi:hypothetical protein